MSIASIPVMALVRDSRDRHVLFIGECHVPDEASAFMLQRLVDALSAVGAMILLERPQFTKTQRLLMGGAPDTMRAGNVSPIAYVGLHAPGDQTCVGVGDCAAGPESHNYLFADPRTVMTQSAHTILAEYRSATTRMQGIMLQALSDSLWDLMHGLCTCRKECVAALRYEDSEHCAWNRLAQSMYESLLRTAMTHSRFCSRAMTEDVPPSAADLEATLDVRNALDVVMTSTLAALPARNAVYMTGYNHTDDVLKMIYQLPSLHVLWEVRGESCGLSIADLRYALAEEPAHL